MKFLIVLLSSILLGCSWCDGAFISKNDLKISNEILNLDKFDDNIVFIYIEHKKEDTGKLKSEMDGFLIGLQGYVRLVKANVTEYIEKSFALKKQGSPYSIQYKLDREEFIRKMEWGEKEIKSFDEIRSKIQDTWKELLGLLESIDPKRFKLFECFLRDSNPVYDSPSESLSYHALEDD
uniref:Uncharacterized protein n=1 Tax=Clastoptera arizonana TaxID=38151 RepID=A0A1B6CGF2_9HEMI